MGFFASLIIGLLAGLLAGKLMGVNYGIIVNTLLGLLGGALGGWIFSLLGIHTDGGWIGSIITGLVGAVVILYVAKLLKK